MGIICMKVIPKVGFTMIESDIVSFDEQRSAIVEEVN